MEEKILRLQELLGISREEATQLVTSTTSLAGASLKTADIGDTSDDINGGGTPQDQYTSFPTKEGLPKDQYSSFPTDSQRQFITPTGEGETAQPEDKDSYLDQATLLNPGGYNLETKAANIGRFAGMEKGAKGRGLGLAGSIGSFALGAARTGLSNFATQKRSNEVQDFYNEKRTNNRYIEAPQSSDANFTGGYFEYGGVMKKYPYGGTYGEDEKDNLIYNKRRDNERFANRSYHIDTGQPYINPDGTTSYERYFSATDRLRNTFAPRRDKIQTRKGLPLFATGGNYYTESSEDALKAYLEFGGVTNGDSITNLKVDNNQYFDTGTGTYKEVNPQVNTYSELFKG